jgi:DNA-binding NarL/FixJ family response regulator
MVRGDWTLVDCVESDGKRYVVARENAPKAKPIPELTERETQVVALANLGRHNKLIAYELGIADSTVRVLLSRAAAKLGVGPRAELLQVANERVADGGGTEATAVSSVRR